VRIADPIRLAWTPADTDDDKVFRIDKGLAKRSVQVSLSAGATLEYSIQYTCSPEEDLEAATVVWTDSAVTGEAGNVVLTQDFPATGIKIDITAYTDGTVTVDILQTG
jgi:hypothetical protein